MFTVVRCYLFNTVIDCHADDYTILYTDGNDQSEMRIWTLAATYLKFSVKACSDAKLSLTIAPKYVGEASYVVILGAESNSKTLLERTGNDGFVETFPTQNVRIYQLLFEFK